MNYGGGRPSFRATAPAERAGFGARSGFNQGGSERAGFGARPGFNQAPRPSENTTTEGYRLGARASKYGNFSQSASTNDRKRTYQDHDEPQRREQKLISALIKVQNVPPHIPADAFREYMRSQDMHWKDLKLAPQGKANGRTPLSVNC